MNIFIMLGVTNSSYLLVTTRSKGEINSLEDELKQCRYQIEHLSNQLQLFQNSAPYRTP